jgi:integrase
MNTVLPHRTGPSRLERSTLDAPRSTPSNGQSGSDRPRIHLQVTTDRAGRVRVTAPSAERPAPLRFTFKSGSQTIEFPYYLTKWYDKKRRKHFRSCTFVWKDGNVRRREKRSTVERAKKRAAEIATAILDHQVAQANFTESDRAAYRQCQDSTRKTGKSVVTICASFADMHSRLPSGFTSLEQIFDIGLRNAPTSAVAKTTVEIFKEMIPARENDGLAKNTTDELSSRLKAFTADFPGPILSITSTDINNWLRARKLIKEPTKLVSKKTRNHFRNAISELYRYARECGYIPKTWTPLDEVPKVKIVPVVIKTFPPADVIKLIAARIRMEIDTPARYKRKTLIPYLAIGFFAGLRHEEMSAGKVLPVLDWAQVDFGEKKIHVLPEVARKKGSDRYVPMQPNLIAWLKPYAQTSGKVCELSNATNELVKTAEAAGVKWKKNGLRKTFISSRLAIIEDIGKVATEAGTSPDRINHNYKETRTRKVADQHFDIWPTKSEDGIEAAGTSADILQVEFALRRRA